ncbi:putative membrane protein [Bacillus phage vB_BspM_MarvelLand]|nr:putative membrane protein [Bacillus phage vB_BspM_MarvelLand]
MIKPTINLGARKFDSWVEYTPFKKVTVTQAEDKSVFMVNNLVEEVVQEVDGKRVKKIKKMKKLLKVAVSVLGVSLNTAPKAFAATATIASSTLTPAMIFKYGLMVASIAVAVGVVTSIVALSMAGTYRMFGKKQEANAWSQDIIRGLVQVLISIPSVYLLYYLAKLLFDNLDFLKLAL